MNNNINLSAEASKKWLNCTPSVNLERKITTPAKEESHEEALARKFMEIKLQQNYGKSSMQSVDYLVNAIKANPYYSKRMDKSLEDLLIAIKRKIATVESTGERALIIFGERLDNSLWIKGGTARVPIAILTRDTLEIISFDYNDPPVNMEDKFVEMELYALAVINEYICLYEMRIVLLRYFSLSENKIHEDFFYVDKLLEKAEILYKPKSEVAYSGGGELKPGYYCNECRARFLCSSEN